MVGVLFPDSKAVDPAHFSGDRSWAEAGRRLSGDGAVFRGGGKATTGQRRGGVPGGTPASRRRQPATERRPGSGQAARNLMRATSGRTNPAEEAAVSGRSI
jgi:hypothetical protein